jgi:hypothetical protein
VLILFFFSFLFPLADFSSLSAASLSAATASTTSTASGSTGSSASLYTSSSSSDYALLRRASFWILGATTVVGLMVGGVAVL